MGSIKRWPEPPHEAERLRSLRAYDILDTPSDPRFDAITRAASAVIDTPIALISFVDEKRQWFKSAIGLSAESETGRDVAFCSHAILSPSEPMIVENAIADPRFVENPLVTGPPGIRFYAGFPIVNADHHALGTLCVIDTKPRQISKSEIATLTNLSAAIGAALDLHRAVRDLRKSEEHHRFRVEFAPQMPWLADGEGTVLEVSPRWVSLSGMTHEELLGRGWIKTVHPDDRAERLRHWEEAVKTGNPFDLEYRLRRSDGTYRWYRARATSRLGNDGRPMLWYGTTEDIHDRKLSEARVTYLAYHDDLTGLVNRARLHELAAIQVAQIETGKRFALLSVDLDGFKAVNDTLGHVAGDKLLKIVAKRLASVVSPEDIVARVGGDEFVVLQASVDEPDDVTVLAARILEVLATPMDVDDHSLTIGASIGISMCPQHATDVNGLLQTADLALYRAKQNDRGSYRTFAPAMDEDRRRQQSLAIMLRDALDRGEFRLAYQPQVDLRSNRITGFEALLRWQHPLRGAIMPTEFIPIAERTGLIIAIGEWALRRACEDVSHWPGEISVAVNVSSIQFGRSNLPRLVEEVLSKTKLAPRRLELEITESVSLLDNETNLSLLHQLRALGLRIALDDFGTGYSSLAYLQRFKFDKLKIDQMFIKQMAVSQDALAILHAVVNLSRDLGITTMAEGIETNQQLEYVRAEGCDQGQGYLFGAPMSAERATAALLKTNFIKQEVKWDQDIPMQIH